MKVRKQRCSSPRLFHASAKLDALDYFHLTDGKQVLNNRKGIDLSGNAAARDDALALARDLKHGAVMPGWDWTGWFVTIVDQHGHKVDKVPIADV